MRLIQLDPALADPDRVARHLRFSTDGRSLAAVLGPPDGRRVVVRYDLHKDTGTVIPEPSHDDEGREDAPDPAVSPDLELVAEVLLGVEGEDWVRLTDTWAKPPTDAGFHFGDADWPTGVGFAADGAVLLVGVGASEPEVLRFEVEGLLDGADPLDVARPPLAVPDAEPVAFADTPNALAVGTAEGTVVVFDLTGTRRPLTVEHDRGRKPLRQLAFSPDGRRLITRGLLAVAVWDVATGAELARLRGPQPLTGFALTPDGRHLLTCSTDGTVCRFDAESFALADRLDWGLGPLHGLAVAPDGLTAAAGASGGRVVVWDL